MHSTLALPWPNSSGSTPRSSASASPPTTTPSAGLSRSCALTNKIPSSSSSLLELRSPGVPPHLYNTVFNGYLVTVGIDVHILQLYSKMLHCSVCPSHFTFPAQLRTCCVPDAVEVGTQLHAHVFKLGHGGDAVSQNNLIHMYVNHGHLEKARRVFNRMPASDAVSWTTLISGYAWWGRVDDAHRLFPTLEITSWQGKNHPWAAWNSLIAAFDRSNRFQEAFPLFARMREEVALEKYVAATMLLAAPGLEYTRGGWESGLICKL